MKLADMRERIVIEETYTDVDAFDNHVNCYRTYCSRWAQVNKRTGNEDFNAGQTIEKEKLYFIIRFDSVTRRITPGKHRILFRGKRYNITSVDNYKFRNENLTLDAEEINDNTASQSNVE